MSSMDQLCQDIETLIAADQLLVSPEVLAARALPQAEDWVSVHGDDGGDRREDQRFLAAGYPLSGYARRDGVGMAVLYRRNLVGYWAALLLSLVDRGVPVTNAEARVLLRWLAATTWEQLLHRHLLAGYREERGLEREDPLYDHAVAWSYHRCLGGPRRAGVPVLRTSTQLESSIPAVWVPEVASRRYRYLARSYRDWHHFREWPDPIACLAAWCETQPEVLAQWLENRALEAEAGATSFVQRVQDAP